MVTSVLLGLDDLGLLGPRHADPVLALAEALRTNRRLISTGAGNRAPYSAMSMRISHRTVQPDFAQHWYTQSSARGAAAQARGSAPFLRVFDGRENMS